MTNHREVMPHTEYDWKERGGSRWVAYVSDDNNGARLEIYPTGVSELYKVVTNCWRWEVITQHERIVSDSDYATDWHAATAAERAYKKHLRSPEVMMVKVMEKLDVVLRELEELKKKWSNL